MMDELLGYYDREAICTYNEENYSVRDNGAVYRHCKEGLRKRKLDEVWTFGSSIKREGYRFIGKEPIHRIVATAFLGPPSLKEFVVDHINTITSDNRPQNLSWETRGKNSLISPNTVRQIEIAYGSVETFVIDPAKPLPGKLHPNFEWLSSISKKVTEGIFRPYLDWVKSRGLHWDTTFHTWFNKYRFLEIEAPKPVDEKELQAKMNIEQQAYEKYIQAASKEPFTPSNCKKCSSKLVRQFLHIIPISCWRCSAEMKIALVDIEHAIVGPSGFSDDEIKIATECGALLKENYSQAKNEAYLSNTCPNCKSMTGDWFLHHYYDQEERETGIPVRTICLSCEHKEIGTEW